MLYQLSYVPILTSGNTTSGHDPAHIFTSSEGTDGEQNYAAFRIMPAPETAV